jgi:hypothetical protein
MSFTGKPALTHDVTITNGLFWPVLSLGDFLADYRIPAEYADNTVAYGIKAALAHVNPDLELVRITLMALGFDTLAEAAADSGDVVGGEPDLLFYYKKAVFSHAKAYLLQQFNSMNRRKEAENLAKEAPEVACFWLDESQQAKFFIIKKVVTDANVTANHGVYVALI